MITYQIETWDDYFRDCQVLWIEHYDEIAVQKDRMEMKPDVPAYMALERDGRLQILTARESGEMIGYVLTVIRPHLHYANVLCGFEDSYFLSKRHRRGWTGVKLIREAERRMKQIGVQKVFWMTKSFLDMGAIFKRLGYVHSDTVYAKWIGN